MAAKPEIESLEIAFRSAQARLGIAAGLLARDEWMSLSVTEPSKGEHGMLMRLLRIILGIRSMSRRLTKSYYRLARGLETGYTLDEAAEDTTLAALRGEFEDDLTQVQTLDFTWPDMTAEERYAADEMKAVSAGDKRSWNPGELSQSMDDWLDSIVTEDGDVVGEKFTFTADRISDLQDAIAAFRPLLGSKGVRNLETKIRAIKQKYADDPDRMLAEIENAFILVRDTIAGIVDDDAIGSGKDLLEDTIVKDKRAKFYARGVRSNPCAFCSMLASRGFVYKSERTALAGRHPNCHCYPIIRWSDDPVLPERNDYYNRMWPVVTADYDGKDKMRAWRRWIEAERRKRAKAS